MFITFAPAMSRSIFLIGFMGSGKTTVGRLLGERLGWKHLDLDRVIEAEVGPLLPYVQKHGENSFRDVERRTLGRFLDEDRHVISLGGGTPCSFDNMDRLLASGTVIFIDTPLVELQDRLERKGTDRPLLFGLSSAELRQRVADLLNERLPVYRRAEVIVDGSGTPQAIAERAVQALSDQLK